MGMMFCADEVFEIVIQIEWKGAKFYRQAAARFADDDIRGELLQLAAMEDGHELTFADLRKKLTANMDGQTWEDAEQEALKYLENFANGRVFDMTVDPTGLLPAEASLKQVLQCALERERDSIVFFVGLKELVLRSLGKETIDSIIQQEMGHVTLLSRKLENLA